MIKNLKIKSCTLFTVNLGFCKISKHINNIKFFKNGKHENEVV